MEIIARVLLSFYEMLWPFLALTCLVGGPLLAVYFVVTYIYVSRPESEESVLSPIVAWLRYLVAGIFGILLPCFYFICVRTKREFGTYELGRGTNTGWGIALGLICVAGLLSLLLRGILRGRSWRANPGWPSLVLFGLGFLLALRYQLMTFVPIVESIVSSGEFPGGVTGLLFGLLFPETAYGGATLVFGLGLYEAVVRTMRKETPSRLSPVRRIAAFVLPVLLLVLFSAPFLLSLPRETRKQTLELISHNSVNIHEVATAFDLDPKLLAGIIYVAHTRDRPRWTGEAIETIGLRMSLGGGQYRGFLPGEDIFDTLVDPSVGIAQIRISTLLWLYQPQWDYRVKTSTSPVGQLSGETHLVRFGISPNAGPYPGLPDVRDARRNLAHGALYLAWFRQQWKDRNGNWSIDEKPEILATLYNIGHERSVPKADPKPNDFGRRVKAAMDDPELLKALGTGEGVSE